MRIAIITEGYYPELSGVTTSLYQRLLWLSRSGHQVQVFAPDYSKLKHLYPDYQSHLGEIMPGITVIPFPSRPYHLEYLRDPIPFSFDFIASRIARFRPEIIHTECPERLFMGFLTRPGVKLGRRLGIPVTAFYHTNYLAYIEDYKKQIVYLKIPGIESLLREMMIWVYNSCTLTMVPSRTTENYLKRAGICNTRYDMYLGVDIETYGLSPNLAPAAGSKTRIAYIGRLTPDKQIDLLLKIFEAVRSRTDECEFVIVGGGQELDKVRAWAGNHSDTTVTGWVPNHKTVDYYKSAATFVTASPKENHPLTILEAMASGVPVVGPNAGGVGELVENGRTGYLVPENEISGYVEAIMKLVNDPLLRNQMGLKAFNNVLNRSWKKGTQRMLNVWEDLIDKNRSLQEAAVSKMKLDNLQEV